VPELLSQGHVFVPASDWEGLPLTMLGSDAGGPAGGGLRRRRQQFTLERMLARTQAVYRKVLEASRRGRRVK